MRFLIKFFITTKILKLYNFGLIVFRSNGKILFKNHTYKELAHKASDSFNLDNILINRLQDIISREESARSLPYRLKLAGSNFKFLYTALRFPKIYPVLVIEEEHKDAGFKQEITRNISHELKTPLTSIRGYVETILGNPLMDQELKRHFLDRALKNVERLEELIRDLSILDMASDGSRYLKKKQCNLSQIVFNSVKNLEFRAEQSGIEINLADFPEQLIITGDSRLLEAIFINLIENGIKYSRPGDRVHVKYSGLHSGFNTIEIYDTGPGIPAEYHDKIFERFFRIDSGRSRKTGGTGLGLSIVKHAVAFHNGTIEIDKNYNSGTKFLLRFPG
ncbi:MAG: hypothetical protein GXP33_06820 [Spirochaetes bacterium]|nr:hypothetical protein [Spirochaetota bacterium]